MPAAVSAAADGAEVTRRRQPPERERLFLTTALSNPALREIDAETTDPAQFGDVVQCVAFALVAAGFAALLAHGVTTMLGRSGYAMHAVAAGSVGLVALLIRAGQIADSRRGRQWATFDRQPGETVKAPEFVPVSDSGRTLIRDTALRRKVVRFAELLPGVGYSLAYRQWTGRGRLFSRSEFETVRAMMQAAKPAPLEVDNQITQAGRDAVARWRVGNFIDDERRWLRPTPAGPMDMHDD